MCQYFFQSIFINTWSKVFPLLQCRRDRVCLIGVHMAVGTRQLNTHSVSHARPRQLWVNSYWAVYCWIFSTESVFIVIHKSWCDLARTFLRRHNDRRLQHWIPSAKPQIKTRFNPLQTAKVSTCTRNRHWPSIVELLNLPALYVKTTLLRLDHCVQTTIEAWEGDALPLQNRVSHC